MKQFKKNLGKVSLTPEGIWDSNKEYEILSIVCDEHTQHGFISKKEVPPGVDLYNSEYWMPLNVSGFADNNMIILSKKTSDASIQSYTLEEAVKSIPSVGRRPGTILGFYNLNTDRLDIGGRWELWQYNAVDVANWEDLATWQNIYYNFNRFVGWYRDENTLKAYFPYPEIGCYAYVGNLLERASIYRCDAKYSWVNTNQAVWDYIQVVLDGNVKVGPNGNWFNNGEDTGIPAVGPAGKTPTITVRDNKSIDITFDNEHWETLVQLVDITPKIVILEPHVLDASELPTLENEGDDYNVNLRFGLPKSPDVNIDSTVTGTTGDAAKVENLGDEHHLRLKFTIPRGVQGAPGQKGDGWQIKGFVDSVSELPSSGAVGDLYLVGTAEPYDAYVYKNDTSKFVNIGNSLEVKAGIFDGGRADTQYGGARVINCGGADAYLTY